MTSFMNAKGPEDFADFKNPEEAFRAHEMYAALHETVLSFFPRTFELDGETDTQLTLRAAAALLGELAGIVAFQTNKEAAHEALGTGFAMAERKMGMFIDQVENDLHERRKLHDVGTAER